MRFANHLVITLLLSLLSASGQSQSTTHGSLKSYNGKFEYGNATYSYYENDQLERIYHGDFKYKYEVNGETIVSAKGTYSDGQMDGVWEFVSYDWKTVGELKGGLLNGTWKTTSIKDGTVKSIASFDMGNFTGDFQMTSNKLEVIGSFDENGRMHGTWKFMTNESRYNDKLEHIMKFEHGILSYYLNRKFETGEIIQKRDQTELVTSFLNSESSVVFEFNNEDYTLVEYKQVSNDYSETFALYEYGFYHESWIYHESLGKWLYYNKTSFKPYFTLSQSFDSVSNLLKESKLVRVLRKGKS